MRRPAQLAHRFIQHMGTMAIPTIVLAELYAGAYKHPNSSRLLSLIADLLQEVLVISNKKFTRFPGVCPSSAPGKSLP